tara:strand:+ start:891 stop:1805 length:915 start_codon:yes stop_codon:yes gene_type:complete
MTAKVIKLDPLAALDAQAKQIEQGIQSPRTVDAYQRVLASFDDWCQTRGVSSCSRSAIAYLTEMHNQGLAYATINQAYSALVQAGYRSERLENLIQSLKREHATRPKKRLKALTPELAQAMIGALDLSTHRGIRDRALLTTAWVTASRKKELLGLDVNHIVSIPDGFTLQVVEKGSIDSRLKLVLKDFALDAYQSLKNYLDLVGDTGPLWRPVSRADRLVDRRLSRSGFDSVFSKTLQSAGIDPSQYSPHSIRAGFITDCAKRGVHMAITQAVTGHKSLEAMKRYYDQSELLQNHPMSMGDNDQ